LRRIEAAIGKLEQRLGRAPTEHEVSAELDMPLGEYQKMLQEARGYQLISFEDFNHSDGEDYLDRHCEDRSANPLDALLDRKLRERLVRGIEGLPEREKVVMGLYYEEELNFREIGETLGVSESRVCQLHSQAIARLRNQLRTP
jgi:RNA polymerase sigma factor for flagellar operon FliA